MFWTDDRVALLKQLIADKQNLSADQIARRLGGISRNAVIGKIHRLNLEWDRQGRKGVHVSKPAALKNRTANAALRRSTHAAKAPPQPPKFPVHAVVDPIIEDVPPSKRRKFADLMPASCRWPLGAPGHPEFGFCPLDHAEGLPYCEGHARVAYASPRVSVRAEPVAAKALVEA